MEYQTLLIIIIPAAMVHVAEEYKFGWVEWANSFISGVTVRQFIIIDIGNYAYLVPFVENDNEVFLKTIIPSRKATKQYLEVSDEK